MLTSTLPELIKPTKLSRQDLLLKGTFPLETMKRLTAEAASSDGIVNVDVAFTKDVQGFSIMQGVVNSCVQLQCQRCLDAVGTELSVNLSLAFVTHESRVKQVPSIYEAVLLDSEEISFIELLEDELILALPIMAYHDKCKAYQYRTEEELESEKVEEAQQRADNPFDVLEQLKGKLKP